MATPSVRKLTSSVGQDTVMLSGAPRYFQHFNKQARELLFTYRPFFLEKFDMFSPLKV